MYNFFNKNGITIFALLGGLISIITVLMISSADEAIMDEVKRYGTATNFGLRSIYTIGISCAVLAIALPIYNSLGDPKKLVKPLIGLAALGVVFLICWGAASAEFDVTKFGPETEFDLSESTAKMVGGMLITMYSLIVIAIFGILVTEIMKIFK